MRKILNKKVSFFGKEISVIAIAFVAMIGLAAAALVPYLSGMVTGTTTISSPVKLSIAQDSSSASTATWATAGTVQTGDYEGDSNLAFSSIYGGESETFWVKAENLATARMDGYLVFEVYCDRGFASDGGDIIKDFEATITRYDWNNTVSPVAQRIIGPIASAENAMGKSISSDNKTVRIWTNSYLFEKDQNGDEYYVKVNLGFARNALGSYTVKAAFINEGEDPATATFPTP